MIKNLTNVSYDYYRDISLFELRMLYQKMEKEIEDIEASI